MKTVVRTALQILCVCLASQAAPASRCSRDALRVVGAFNGTLEARAEQLWPATTHNSSFHEMAATARPGQCEDSDPPQELATPDPLLEPSNNDMRITISFVVGRDGRVYSALILEGDSGEAGRNALNTVRHWRFRPAVCNGAPTEFEAKVEFSSHANRF